MIERRERLGLAFETRYTIGVSGKRVGQHLDGNLTTRVVSVPRYTCPMPPWPICAVTS